MRLVHELGKFIALENDGVERLRYHYQMEGDPDPSAPKPFVHPIRTPGGALVTNAGGRDQFWHRGLWFAWKFVNGVNYWEENQRVLGRQVTLALPRVEPVGDLSGTMAARWTSDLAWRDHKNGVETTRIAERRTITCRLDEKGALVLDWVSEETMNENVSLDRTLFTSWGGYSGLVVRLAPTVAPPVLVFDDGTRTDRPLGRPHRWGGMEGVLRASDGTGEAAAAFVFLPSPRNRRFPEPFNGAARLDWNFFGPAPLFLEPLALEQGEVLRQACRVLVLPRPIDPAEVEDFYADWLVQEKITS